jgi:hypothetical protein
MMPFDFTVAPCTSGAYVPGCAWSAGTKSAQLRPEN